jgi:hypothetical protein
MRRSLIGALGALLLLGTPGAASAQERGVHVDPGSPAGKEYAIPIERARREASGGSKISSGNTSTQAAAPVPLFGQGIKPAPPKRHKHKTTSTSKTTTTKPAPVALAPTAAVEAALTKPSTTAWTGGIPAVVLAAGIVLGLGLRRRRRV